jgi:dTDP-4-dehydrorhamnose 3,5-epimerase
MRFIETGLDGAFIITPEPIADSRGFFARVFCSEEFAAHGLDYRVAQCNVSFNPVKGTLRGLHYQVEPHREVKLVRCTLGGIFDVIVDLRPGSPTHLRWIGVELSAANRTMLYVPKGCAHGYMTLCDNTEVFYQVSEFHRPEYERGLRWDDPSLGIEWPLRPASISQKDRSHPWLSA